MRTMLLMSMVALMLGCQRNSERFDPDQIVALERAALDRWGKGDPQGYVEIMASEITYFDPFQEKRIDGLDGLKQMLAPITGKISISRFDMIDPRVQHHGDVALLTFNLVSYQKQADGTERAVARWNSTETYARLEDRWRIIHSHWSFIKPELKQPVTEEANK